MLQLNTENVSVLEEGNRKENRSDTSDSIRATTD